MSWARIRRLGSSSAGSSPLLGKDKKKEDKEASHLSPLEKLLQESGKDAAPVLDDGSDKFFGMENFGNSCYMNAILQSLYYSEPFREEVISYPERAPIESILSTPDGQPRVNTKLVQPPNAATLSPSKQKNPASPATAKNPAVPTKPEDKNSAEYKKKQALLKGPILKMDYDNAASYGMKENLFTSLKDVFEGIVANRARIGVVSPSKLLATVRDTNELFRSPMHQDAHEFLNMLLNEVNDRVEEYSRTRNRQMQALPQANGVPKSPTASPTSTASAVTIVPSAKWVYDLFQGTLTSETRCLTCENLSQRDEPFIDLSVDIEQHSSVTACLRKFSEEEMLCERNKFHCDNCGGLQEAEKRMKIKRLPRILALHLKRFKYTDDFSRLEKLFHRVVYPFHLRLFNTTDDAEDPDKLYELYAIVVHIGAGPYQGHYIAVVKTKEAGWLLFDDELVEPVQKEFVQNFFGDRPGQACAYLLFYQETTIEAVRREQAREGMRRAPPPAAQALAIRDHGLGLDLKNINLNHVRSATVLETPLDEVADPLSKAATTVPLSSIPNTADNTPAGTPLFTTPSNDPPNAALQHAATSTSLLAQANGSAHSHMASPVNTNGSTGLFSKMRRGSKSGGKKPFWGSLDLSKEGKKEKDKDLLRSKSKELTRESEAPSAETLATAESEASPQVTPVPAQEDEVSETPKKNRFSSLRRRATELRKSSSRTNIQRKREEKVGD